MNVGVQKFRRFAVSSSPKADSERWAQVSHNDDGVGFKIAAKAK